MKSKDDSTEYVISTNLDVCVAVRKGGYRPKSVFLMTSCLNNYDISGKNVLDLGCGETGILAHYSAARNANKVIGVDIDPSTISYVKKASFHCMHQIKWVVSNFFDNLAETKFDLILSNPPQTPVSDNNRGNLLDWHDSVGPTGREAIVSILNGSRSYLKKEGEMFLLIFDFLGIKKAFNSAESIFEIANKRGFHCEIVEKYQRKVRKGGQIEKNMTWIKTLYPSYEFEKEKGSINYGISVVRFLFKG